MKTSAIAMLLTTALVPFAAVAQTNSQPRAGTPNQPAQQNQQQNQNQNQNRSQMQTVSASDLQGMTVINDRGDEVGEVERLVIGKGDQAMAVIAFGDFLELDGQTRVIPLSRLRMNGDQLVAHAVTDAGFRRLTTYESGMDGYREASAGYRAQLQTASADAADQQNRRGSRIIVQQGTPNIRVDPADPRVTVRQAQPRVTVNQDQPEIIVRQRRPTVRVDIPQPEIIVRMPEPDVNVAMSQPQVQVNQPRPRVEVTRRQQQPQVQVEEATPEVMIQRSVQSQSNVQFNRADGQPTVRYERAEPRVIVNSGEGQPTVRIERQGQSPADRQDGENRQASNAQSNDRTTGDQQAQQRQQAQSNRNAGMASGQAASSAETALTDEDRQRAKERLSVGEVNTTASTSTQPVRNRNVLIGDLTDMDIFNARGEQLGEIERVVADANGRRFVVISHGGFLGFGEDRVAFPLQRFGIQGDRLVIRGVTEADIEAMDDYRAQAAAFNDVGEAESARVRIW